jgi:4-hydroxybenzoyl-CoA reductase subunit alpha
MAAAEAKRQLLEYATAKLAPNVIYDLDIKDRWVHLVARPEKRISYLEVVKDAMRAKNGQPIIARGYYTPIEKG